MKNVNPGRSSAQVPTPARHRAPCGQPPKTIQKQDAAQLFTPVSEIPIPIRRRAAAIHEAGHAVVAIVLGKKVTEAILRGPNGTSGETRFEDDPAVFLDPNIEAHRHIIEDAVVVGLGGQIAEAVFWEQVRSLYRPYIDSHRDDDQYIAELKDVFEFTAFEDAAFMRRCYERSREIIMKIEAQFSIEEIAYILSDRRSISRTEIDAVLQRHNLV